MKNKIETKKPFLALAEILRIIILGTLGGIAIALISAGEYSLRGIMWGIACGLCITILSIYGYSHLFPKLRYLRFIYFLLIKITYYTVVIIFIISIPYIFTYFVDGRFNLTSNRAVQIISSSLFLSFFINATITFRQMLGQKTLLNLVTGKYHKPVREERTFMFLDIASSTSIAEKIGDLNFHVLINDFFYDLTKPIVAHKGEVYKYVGDEIIISWKYPAGFIDQHCIRCFFAIEKVIAARKDYYLEKFGFVPTFRAGIHFGPVVIGEMGNLKLEIAFLGDTVNTTARVQEACKKYSKDIIISGQALQHLNLSDEFIVTKLDETQLRGKETLSTLYSIDHKP